MNLANVNSVTDGMEGMIEDGIKVAIQKNSIDTFNELSRFVTSILGLCIDHAALDDFKRYIVFPSTYYNLSAFYAKSNANLLQIHQECFQDAVMTLRSVIWISLGFEERKVKGLEKQKILNQFYYHAFADFSQLLYSIVKAGNHVQFKAALKEYGSIDRTYSSENLIENKLFDLRHRNKDGEYDNEIEALVEQLKQVLQFDMYKVHVLLGIKHWIYYLYHNGDLEKADTLKFVSQIGYRYREPKEAFRDILKFRRMVVGNYLNWNSWYWRIQFDSDEKGAQGHYPLHWLTFGFFLDRIQDGSVFIDLSEYGPDDVTAISSLYDDIASYGKYLLENFEKWEDFVKLSKEEVQARIDRILSDIAISKKQGHGQTESSIAQADLNPEKIIRFKDIIGSAWFGQARMHRLFHRNENIEIIKDPNVKLNIVGQRTFFEKAKMMFTDEHHQMIYGVEQMGSTVGRWEDNLFFKTLLESGLTPLQEISMLQLLNKSIATLKAKEVIPNMIFISPEYVYKDQDFLNSKLFVSKLESPLHDADLGFFHLGIFDGIPIYSSYSHFLKNKAVVCDFTRAFSMQYKSNPSWYKEELKVDVEKVTREVAEQKFDENPEKWLNPSDDIKLNKEEALTLIQTSVIIDIWTTKKFIINDPIAFVMGNVTGILPD